MKAKRFFTIVYCILGVWLLVLCLSQQSLNLQQWSETACAQLYLIAMLIACRSSVILLQRMRGKVWQEGMEAPTPWVLAALHQELDGGRPLLTATFALLQSGHLVSDTGSGDGRIHRTSKHLHDTHPLLRFHALLSQPMTLTALYDRSLYGFAALQLRAREIGFKLSWWQESKAWLASVSPILLLVALIVYLEARNVHPGFVFYAIASFALVFALLLKVCAAFPNRTLKSYQRYLRCQFADRTFDQLDTYEQCLKVAMEGHEVLRKTEYEALYRMYTRLIRNRLSDSSLSPAVLLMSLSGAAHIDK